MAKKIKFKFDSNQEHQNIAVESVVDLFDGYSPNVVVDEFTTEISPNIDPYYSLDENWLLENLQFIQDQHNLSQNFVLDVDDGPVIDIDGYNTHRFPSFTVEMETGTGKTYTYLKTIFELNKRYGFRKFIIVVPSVAIYEGVFKSIEITREHFKTLYGNTVFNAIKYDGQQIGKVKDFAVNPYINIMIMTVDSFNSKSNVLYKATEKIPGEMKPYQYIQQVKPIFILDESQNYKSPKSREALRTVNPLFAINYSATPVPKPNLVNRLTPVDALRYNLVKKIQVEGITEEHNLNDPNLNLIIEEVKRTASGIQAEVKAHCFENGARKEKTITLKMGSNLYDKTKNEEFQGFIVEDINTQTNTVSFTNGSSLSLGKTQGITLSKSEIFRVQIEQTIRYHIERQLLLKSFGIKVLSLFFIDRVDNYAKEDGIIKVLFDQAFNKLKHLDPDLKNLNPEDVRAGYFAKKKTGKTTEDFTDTAIEDAQKTKDDKEAEKKAYQLIMKDKEDLLNFSTPQCFLFAHSALREGWDNPNVFQICTLNTANSENRKRQEIGRGLRLAVNQSGERVPDENINILTVIANESYEEYCKNLQNEYLETGDIPPTKPTNTRKGKAVRNDDVFNLEAFKLFWENLSKKTDYIINIDTEELIEETVARFNSDSVSFPETQIVISRGKFVLTTFTFTLLKVSVGLAQIEITIKNTDGSTVSSSKDWYKEGYDFGRKYDKRLSGYKIVEIKEFRDDAIVHFGNGEQLQLNRSIEFSDNAGYASGSVTRQEAQTNFPVFNIIDRASKELGITKPTILNIFKGISAEKKAYIFRNPEGFSSKFIDVIRNELADHIAEKIEYTLSQELENYDLEEVFPKVKEFAQKELIDGSEHSLYDLIQVDSDVEQRFIANTVIPDDENGNVLGYFKFPPTFKIKIPKIIKNYNPDWGIIRVSEDGRSIVSLVRETKGTMNPNLLQFPNEKRKIDCAIKHFAQIGLDYRQVDDKVRDYWKSR